MRTRAALLAVMLGASSNGQADDVKLASELSFQDFLATRKGDTQEYILLGSGWLRALQSGDPERYISHWLAIHPRATVTQVGRMTLSMRSEISVYIWVEFGKESLNVDLIKEGIFPGGVMRDMVDAYEHMYEDLKRPEMASVREQNEKERAEAPQEKPERLISDERYKQFLKRVEAAEGRARAKKRGIWSDAMKEERESEGYP